MTQRPVQRTSLGAAFLVGSLALAAPAVADELVYTPVAPCRVVDTRLAGGALQPGTPRTFRFAGPGGYSAQGGNAGGCGIPGLAGPPGALANQVEAIAVNVVAVEPDGAGHLVGWAANRPQPFASLVNYQKLTPGLNVANGVILPMCDEVGVAPCAGGDLSFEAAVSGVHLVVDVTGYFHAPDAAFGYAYNLTPQTVTIGAAVLFDSTGPSAGVLHAPGSSALQITSSGTYDVEWSVSAVEPNQFAVFVNGVTAPGSRYGSGAGTQQNRGALLVALAAGDVLTLVNDSSAAAVTLSAPNGGTQADVNASLLVRRLD